MKLSTIDRSVEGNLDSFETNQFKIAVNRKSFRVLLDTLYTNKIKTIIQELWTNAYDSHVEAGKADTPFYCHLPNMLDSTFSVRDYGVSMDHETVMELYTTVFYSSKDESNDQVGAYGLGSKTPFAYTDSFTVKAYDDGIVRTYLAALNAEGIPTITKVDSRETDEERGIEVSLTVQLKDFREFKTTAENVALGFDVKPEIGGEELVLPTPTYVHENWRVYPGKSPGVRQGCVVYPIDTRYGGLNLPEIVRNGGIIVDVPIGSVQIAANRESLSLDDETRRNLKAAFENVAKSIVQLIQEDLSKCKNLLDAERRLKLWQQSFTLWGHKFKYGEKALTGQIKIDDLKLTFVDAFRWTRLDSTGYHTNINIDRLSNLRFFINRTDQKIVRKRLRVRSITGGGRRYYRNDNYFMINDPTPQQLAALVRRLDLKKDQIIGIASIPDVPPAPKVSVPVSITGVPLYTPEKRAGVYVNRGWDSFTSYTDTMPDEYYWLPIQKGNQTDAYFFRNLSYIGARKMKSFFDWTKRWLDVPDTELFYLTPRPQSKADADYNFETFLPKHVSDNMDDLLLLVERMATIRALRSVGLDDSAVIANLLGEATIEKTDSDDWNVFHSVIEKIVDDEAHRKSTESGVWNAQIYIEKYPMLFTPTSKQQLEYVRNIEGEK